MIKKTFTPQWQTKPYLISGVNSILLRGAISMIFIFKNKYDKYVQHLRPRHDDDLDNESRVQISFNYKKKRINHFLFRCVNDDAEFCACANISAKSTPYTKVI